MTDMQQLDKKQAVLEERVESRHQEQAGAIDRLITEMRAHRTELQARDAQRDAEMNAMLTAMRAELDTKLADMRTLIANNGTRLIVWTVGWGTALIGLAVAITRYLPPAT